MTIIESNASYLGKRKEQQDFFGISSLSDKKSDKNISHAGVLGIVADGMGGMEKGAEASLLAVQVFMEAYSKKISDEPINEALERSIHEANAAVYEMTKAIDKEGHCGTTLVAAVIHESGLYWIYTGDSRIYLTDGQALQLLTEDQIYARTLDKAVKKGLIEEEAALHHPQREALTSYVGEAAISEVGRGELKGSLPEGASVILCSDGLFKFLPENEILATYKGEPSSSAQRLIDAVTGKNYPNQDNATVVCLHISGDKVQTKKIFQRHNNKNSNKNNKSNAIFIIIALLLFVFLGGTYFYKSREKQEKIPEITVQTQDIVSPDEEIKFDDL